MLKKNSITAIVGKGGTGKTTISGFLIKFLIEKRESPILAIDADPSTCLGSILGVEENKTLGDIREEMINGIDKFPGGMSKQQYLEFQIQSSIQETNYFDLLTMGRPEGRKCYCFVNNLLRNSLDNLTKNYLFTVIDCEAGLEHLSRRTTKDVDYMFIITDPTRKGINTVQKTLELIEKLETKVEQKIFIINRIPNDQKNKTIELLKNLIDLNRFHSVGIIPEDPVIFELDLMGDTIFNVSENAQSYRAFSEIIEGV